MDNFSQEHARLLLELIEILQHNIVLVLLHELIYLLVQMLDLAFQALGLKEVAHLVLLQLLLLLSHTLHFSAGPLSMMGVLQEEGRLSFVSYRIC